MKNKKRTELKEIAYTLENLILDEQERFWNVVEINEEDNYIVMNYPNYFDTAEYAKDINKEFELLKEEAEKLIKHKDITIFFDTYAIHSTF